MTDFTSASRGASPGSGSAPGHTNPFDSNSPLLVSRFARLRPVSPQDYDFVRRKELAAPHSVRWRNRGSTPSPERWAATFWQSVLAQFLAVAADSDSQVIGLLAVYQPSFQDGYASLAVESFGSQGPSPGLMFALVSFVDYVFRTWNFHKLYMEVAEYNLAQFASGAKRLFVQEGQLKQHIWFDGHRWDQFVFAIHREDWWKNASRLRLFARAPQSARVYIGLPREARS